MSQNKKNNDNLKGFEEVMDLAAHESYESERDKRRRSKHDPYELYNFLELENTRLQKLETLLNDKVQNLTQHPTTEHLCDIQQDQIDQTRKQLWSSLHSAESIYLKNLKLLFNNVFN